MKKHLLLINHEYPPIGGGGGAVTKGIVESLANDDEYIISLITPASTTIKSNLPKKVNFYEIPLKRSMFIGLIPDLYLFRKLAVRRVKSLLNNGNIGFDLLWGFFVQTGGYAALKINEDYGTPYILSALGADIYDPTRFRLLRKFTSYQDKKILNKATKVFFPSSNLKELADRFHIKNSKIIPHFHVSKKVGRIKTYKHSDKSLKILSVSRLVKRKNLDLALISIKELKREFSEYKIEYNIVGSGPSEHKLKSLTQQLGLENIVKFHGFLPENDLENLYLSSDIYLLTSFHEAFGITVLEAMSDGLPVISTYCGGPEEFIENGKNGFICDFSPKSIGYYISTVIKSEKGYMEFSKNSLKTAENYSIEKVIKLYKVELSETLIRNNTTEKKYYHL